MEAEDLLPSLLEIGKARLDVGAKGNPGAHAQKGSEVKEGEFIVPAYPCRSS
jgi:hypothetical protein